MWNTRNKLRATAVAVGVASLLGAMPAERAFAQGAPESIDYEGPGSMGLMESLRTNAIVGTMLRSS